MINATSPTAGRYRSHARRPGRTPPRSRHGLRPTPPRPASRRRAAQHPGPEPGRHGPGELQRTDCGQHCVQHQQPAGVHRLTLHPGHQHVPDGGQHQHNQNNGDDHDSLPATQSDDDLETVNRNTSSRRPPTNRTRDRSTGSVCRLLCGFPDGFRPGGATKSARTRAERPAIPEPRAVKGCWATPRPPTTQQAHWLPLASAGRRGGVLAFAGPASADTSGGTPVTIEGDATPCPRSGSHGSASADLMMMLAQRYGQEVARDLWHYRGSARGCAY